MTFCSSRSGTGSLATIVIGNPLIADASLQSGGILVVTGNVVLTQGKTVLRGPKLNANLKTNKMDMTGGRVKGSFVPSSN